MNYDYNKIKKFLIKSGVYPDGVWSPIYIDIDKHDLIMQLSERSVGKTTGWLLFGIAMNVKYGTVIQYIRETTNALNRAYVKDMFSTIQSLNYISKLTDEEWNGVLYKANERKWYFCNREKNGDVIDVSSKHFMIGIGCDRSEDIKSSYNAPRGDLIIVDEFCTKSAYNYFEDLYNIISTIARYRECVKVVFLSNTIDRTHWIFDEFPLRDIINTLEEGEIVKFTTEEGMRFFVEFVFHAQTRVKKHFVNTHLFGFKNSKLTAIKGGGWSVKMYNHIDREEDFDYINKQIVVETTSGYLSLDIIMYKGEPYLFCHKRTTLYNDSIIYSLNDSVLDIRKRYGLGLGDKVDKVIWSLFKNRKIVYSDNRSGMLLDSYIKHAKNERIIL